MSMQVIEDTRRIRNRPPIVLSGRLVNSYSVAKSLNIDQSYLRRVLAGDREPTISYAKKISSYLGMDLQEFLFAIDRRTKSSYVSLPTLNVDVTSLAVSIGSTKASVIRFLTGVDKNPSLLLVQKIASYLSITVDDLLSKIATVCN